MLIRPNSGSKRTRLNGHLEWLTVRSMIIFMRVLNNLKINKKQMNAHKHTQMREEHCSFQVIMMWYNVAFVKVSIVQSEWTEMYLWFKTGRASMNQETKRKRTLEHMCNYLNFLKWLNGYPANKWEKQSKSKRWTPQAERWR